MILQGGLSVANARDWPIASSVKKSPNVKAEVEKTKEVLGGKKKNKKKTKKSNSLFLIYF